MIKGYFYKLFSVKLNNGVIIPVERREKDGTGVII